MCRTVWSTILKAKWTHRLEISLYYIGPPHLCAIFCPLWFAGLFLLGSHTRTSESQKVFTCCSHEKQTCDTNKTKDKTTDKHDARNGDMCKCVSCHLSLVYLPLFPGPTESQMFRHLQYQIPLPLIVCTVMILQGFVPTTPTYLIVIRVI